MFKRIIEFSIRNKPIIGFLVIVLIGFGIYSMKQIPVDAVPDITNNQVQIVTISPSLSPQEVEKFITQPLEITFANITDVIEIRSISRYGLSVITVVFKERVPILDARQLINEQIQIASAELPEGLGNPEMLPITTGLGEVYQYTLEVEEGYENLYDAMELRTIQDWIVNRQLSGIHGIVEISSFGGYLKEYEVAVNPGKLKSYDVTINEVHEALAKNNQNTGGSYVEKGPYAFYIRSEGLIRDLEDIENIVVKSKNHTPVLIRNVADVRFGSPPRFGAMTKDGKGEAVGGITLMLKGANSSEVINEVKDRVERVQISLPEGVKIVPYLDRAALVKKTTGTLATNLIEGGLIVIFILILLLGNFRSGIIVASVIPLSLLFAFIMMHIFGVSANLMSLGAIDFGIVIDGAVIIVESIIYYIYKNYKDVTLTKGEMDSVVAKSSNSIYKSAAFGVFIILIVFIPILTLTGIEGKTFRPMAQTFIFAISGAFLLSVTYVPMISSLFLKKKIIHKRTISDKFIDFLKLSYRPILKLSLKYKYFILGTTLVVFIVSIWSFGKLGGEFIPTLDEGDLAMQMTIPSGSSLSQSIESSTKAEKILIENFPEVLQVVSKIGTAEVPTDPMAIEDADIMIVLKEKDEWVSANTRDELVDMMKEKLSVITAASFEFTQPIQLRFNELMTGVKTDIAVKIYGEDIDELFKQANIAADLISGIPGAADIKVEQITGLPQYKITYDRKQIARYGVNIEDLNNTIRAAYAGLSAGIVFEGERQFNLTVRLDTSCRNNINLDKLMVRLPEGGQIPISEVSTMEYIEGPLQIARDDTKRRVTIGINVRNRDVESLVHEINEKLQPGLELQPGYYITYSGQFENLNEAKKRLALVVPIALLMILILLFFTFNSVKYALLIFSAVPLSAVGGIIALWVRGMPFSISAGVGFIALFGVAVLNGIVLISYYNDLRKEGIKDIDQIVEEGALTRLRPVMMTASTDILGFLPMAISLSAGAEVQRPLATVVIGGIITSTMLTMIILPILYKLINTPRSPGKKRKLASSGKIMSFLVLLMIPTCLLAQSDDEKTTLTIESAVELAMTNNYQIKNAHLSVLGAEAMKKGTLGLEPTEFSYSYGQLNSSLNDQAFEINQNFGSILTHLHRGKTTSKYIELLEYELLLVKKGVIGDVKTAYNQWVYQIDKLKLLQEEFKLYKEFLRISKLKYDLGEIQKLQRVVAETEFASVKNELQNLLNELIISENRLKQLMNADGNFIPADDTLAMYSIAKSDSDGQRFNSTTLKSYYSGQFELEAAQYKLEKSKFFPEISAGYFNQEIDNVKGHAGWNIGVSIPLFFLPQQSNVQQAKIEKGKAFNLLEYQQFNLSKEIENLEAQLNQMYNQLLYYIEKMLPQADLIIKTTGIQFEKEEIEYYEFLQNTKSAIDIKHKYLETLKKYNEIAIQLEYYVN